MTKPATTDCGLESHIGRFIAHLRWVRQLSKHTIDAYRRDLHFLRFCAESPDAINAPILREILVQQSAKGAHPATIARRLAAWRMFFDFLRADKIVAVNPARGINAPKKPSRLPRALTPEQTHRFLSAGVDTKSTHPAAIRDMAITELLYSSALRVSELTALDINDLDGNCALVTVRSGKGGGGVLCLSGRRRAMPYKSGWRRGF